MTGLPKRLFNFAVEQDESVNVLGGGLRGETLSGTFGRAVGAAGGKRHWWGPPLVAVVNAGAWIIARQKDHCQAAARDEAARRAALHED